MLKIFLQITEKITAKWCWMSFAFLLYFLGSVLQAPTANQQTPASTANPQTPASTANPQKPDDNRNLPVIICGIVIAILTLLCVGLAIYICCLKRNDVERGKKPMGTDDVERGKKPMGTENITLCEQKDDVERGKKPMGTDDVERGEKPMGTENIRLCEQKDDVERGEKQMGTENKPLCEQKEELKHREDKVKEREEELKHREDKVNEREENMKEREEFMKMYFRRETVNLDPNTAHPKLLLKGNTVTHVDQWQDVPDNQYRFDSHLYVLGSEGFKSGTHYWVVEVGDKIEWDLGVASESANRKGPITLSPSNGFWAIGLCNETDYWARSAPVIKLKITDKPKMIGVYLQYEAGQISFYNAENLRRLYIFSNCKFDGTLYPFFNPGFSLNGMNSVALKIMNSNSLEPYLERKIASVQ